MQFVVPCVVNEAFPVNLIQDCNCTASAALTLMTYYFDNVDQDQTGGDVISSDVIMERLCRKSVKDRLREAGRTIHGYAGFRSRTRWI